MDDKADSKQFVHVMCFRTETKATCHTKHVTVYRVYRYTLSCRKSANCLPGFIVEPKRSQSQKSVKGGRVNYPKKKCRSCLCVCTVGCRNLRSIDYKGKKLKKNVRIVREKSANIDWSITRYGYWRFELRFRMRRFFPLKRYGYRITKGHWMFFWMFDPMLDVYGKIYVIKIEKNT